MVKYNKVNLVCVSRYMGIEAGEGRFWNNFTRPELDPAIIKATVYVVHCQSITWLYWNSVDGQIHSKRTM